MKKLQQAAEVQEKINFFDEEPNLRVQDVKICEDWTEK